MKKATQGNNFAVLFPRISKEWDKKRNGNLTPYDVMPGSSMKAHWKCEKKGHKWQATLNDRSSGKGCPYCAGKRACKDNCLATLRLDLAREWDKNKNGSLTPNDVTPGSSVKAHWKCQKKGHEWQANISDRTRGNGCPYCAGKRVCKDNCLATLRPDLAREWDKNKNGSLTPNDVTPGSNIKAHWECTEKGHQWEAVISSRAINGNGCPLCNAFFSKLELRVFAELRSIFKDAQLIEKVNNIECDIYLPSINFAIEVDGKRWHSNKERQDIIKNKKLQKYGVPLLRLREEGLPLLTKMDIQFPNKEIDLVTIKNILHTIVKIIGTDKLKDYKIDSYFKRQSFINENGFVDLLKFWKTPLLKNSLLNKYSVLCGEWHQTRNNGLTPENVTPGSNQKVWWKCQKEGHEWQATINNRVYGKGCPYCSGRRACKDNCLTTLRPDLANEWDKKKNGKLTPNDVTIGSQKKVHWKCVKKGHRWQATLNDRSSPGGGCPYCSGRRACKDNCLTTLRPDLANEWDKKRNGRLTPDDVTPKTGKNVHWKCKKRGHKWKAVIANRSNGTGCPYCAGKSACKDNCLATLRPDLAKEWDKKKNGSLTPQDVTINSGKRVHWKCSKKGHEWQTSIDHRSRGTGCKYCKYKH